MPTYNRYWQTYTNDSTSGTSSPWSVYYPTVPVYSNWLSQEDDPPASPSIKSQKEIENEKYNKIPTKKIPVRKAKK